MALLKQVSGKYLQMFCSQSGNTEVEKNVPDNKNCGNTKMFEYTGITLSVEAMPLTTNPKPIKITQAINESSSISKKVATPFTKVKSKKR